MVAPVPSVPSADMDSEITIKQKIRLRAELEAYGVRLTDELAGVMYVADYRAFLATLRLLRRDRGLPRLPKGMTT